MNGAINIESNSPDATEKIAEWIGGRLRGGEVIELISDLGGGKTTFVRGLVRGTGSPDHVSSPTFTVNKIYNAPEFNICHFDFYRLDEAGLMKYEIQEALDDPDTVVIVEWGEIIRHVLPQRRLILQIVQTSEKTRNLKFSFAKSLSYLIDR